LAYPFGCPVRDVGEHVFGKVIALDFRVLREYFTRLFSLLHNRGHLKVRFPSVSVLGDQLKMIKIIQES
jgi:hypothetical protein